MKQLIATLRRKAAEFGSGGVANLALGLGAFALCHGIGRIYAPAGEIVAGLLLLGIAWLLSRGG